MLKYSTEGGSTPFPAPNLPVRIALGYILLYVLHLCFRNGSDYQTLPGLRPAAAATPVVTGPEVFD